MSSYEVSLTHSMKIAESRDREALADYFRRDESAHAYGLADLDQPFWPMVRAFVATERGEIAAVALLLDALGVPLLYAVAAPAHEPTRELLRGITTEIPANCGATLALETAGALGRQFDSEGEFLKMRLAREMDREETADGPDVRSLRPTDLSEAEAFYSGPAYAPGEGGFFLPYMLELGPYFAIRVAGEIVAAGGVHVLSDRYGVVGLGNIATAPESRGRGFATRITRALCEELVPRIPVIALNVRKDAAVVKCYTRLGFEAVLRYEEGLIR